MPHQKHNIIKARSPKLVKGGLQSLVETKVIQDNNYNTFAYDNLFRSRYLAWVAMIFSIVIWFKFSGSTGDQLGNTKNIYRILLVALGAAAALNLILKNSNYTFKTISMPLFLLLIYGITALLSSLMIPANAFYTMWKSLEIIIDVMAMIGIIAATRSPSGPLTAYQWLMIYNTIMITLVILGAIVSPADALRPSRGIIPFFLQGHVPLLNPNTVGFISVQLVIHNLAVYFRSSSRQKYIAGILFIISLTTLILSQSRTSTAGMAAGLIVYLYLDNKKGAALTIIALGSIVMLFTSGYELITEYLRRGQSDELVSSLSGRTEGWAAAWEMFKLSPWIGHGFAAAARTEILGAHGASTLHGALFDVMVGTGIAGLIPWLLAIILMLTKMAKLTFTLSKWAHTKYERSIHAELSAITAILIIRSATSSGTAMHEHAFMLMLCIIGYSYMVDKQIASKR